VRLEEKKVAVASNGCVLRTDGELYVKFKETAPRSGVTKKSAPSFQFSWDYVTPPVTPPMTPLRKIGIPRILIRKAVVSG